MYNGDEKVEKHNLKPSIGFSIIVPIYNTEKYLRECIDSIINQTYSKFELILIDDGSTDCSGKICDEYVEKYHFVKVIHQENKGVSAARNAGIEIAKYDWISFVDSDDWIEPEMLEVLNNTISRDVADLYSFNVRKVDESGDFLRIFTFYPQDQVIIFSSEEQKFEYYYNVLLRYRAGWEAWQRVFKKEIIMEHNLRFASNHDVFAEDYLFTFQYMLYIDKISNICNVLYNHRTRVNSLMHMVDTKSVLPKLYNFAVVGYESADCAEMLYFCDQYYKLYFSLLDNQISYFLGGKSFITIVKMLKKLNNNALHKKWSKQIFFMILKDKKLFYNLFKRYVKKRLTSFGCKL